jgi:hypothetical protein
MEEVPVASTNGVLYKRRGGSMLAKKSQQKKSMANYQKEETYANRIYGAQPNKQNLLSMTVLVGDEIQCHVIKSRRGGDMVEQLQW